MLASVALRMIQGGGKDVGERLRFKTGHPLHESLRQFWLNNEQSFSDLRETLTSLQQAAMPSEREESGLELAIEIRRQLNITVRFINLLESIAARATIR